MPPEYELILATLQRIENRQAHQDERIERIDEAIRGNGHPGLNTRIDRLEQSAVARGFWLKAIGVAMIGQIALLLRGILK